MRTLSDFKPLRTPLSGLFNNVSVRTPPFDWQSAHTCERESEIDSEYQRDSAAIFAECAHTRERDSGRQTVENCLKLRRARKGAVRCGSGEMIERKRDLLKTKQMTAANVIGTCPL